MRSLGHLGSVRLLRERRSILLLPQDVAGISIDCRNGLLRVMAGVDEDSAAGEHGRRVTLAYFDAPSFTQRLGPLRRDARRGHHPVPSRSSPLGPVLAESSRPD